MNSAVIKILIMFAVSIMHVDTTIASHIQEEHSGGVATEIFQWGLVADGIQDEIITYAIACDNSDDSSCNKQATLIENFKNLLSIKNKQLHQQLKSERFAHKLLSLFARYQNKLGADEQDKSRLLMQYIKSTPFLDSSFALLKYLDNRSRIIKPHLIQETLHTVEADNRSCIIEWLKNLIDSYNADRSKQIYVYKLITKLIPFVAPWRLDDEIVLRWGYSNASPFFNASAYGNAEIVTLFIENEVDLADTRNKGSLSIACKNGHVNVVELLLQHGAQIDQVDESRTTLLNLASIYGHGKVVEVSLRRSDVQKTINDPDINGQTPLHSAVRFSYPQVATLLINQGAHVNAEDSSNRTPLEIAPVCHSKDLTNQQVEIIKILLNHGADIRICNYKRLIKKNPWYWINVLPLFIEYEIGVDTLYQLIRHALLQIWTRNNYAYCCDTDWYKQRIKLLLEKGLDINTADQKGTTLLHSAARYSIPSCVLFLLEHSNIEINKKTIDGYTPLDYAIVGEHNQDRERVIKLLIAKGARSNKFYLEAMYHKINYRISSIKIFLQPHSGDYCHLTISIFLVFWQKNVISLNNL